MGPPPAGYEAATIPGGASGGLAGWARDGTCGCGAVLLHGVRSDRRSMLGRADLLVAEGYAVVLADLQAHGASPGERITFGHREQHDAAAVTRWAAARYPGQPVGVVGVSLGGAAAVLAGDDLRADALVLEAVYSDIREATANRLRMRLGTPGGWLAPLLTLQLHPRIGASAADLRPLDAVAHVRAPVLVVGGARDRHTRVDETRALYLRRRAGAEGAVARARRT